MRFERFVGFEGRTVQARWLVGAVAAPICLRVLVILWALDGRFGPLPPYLRALVNADALLVDSIAVVIVAPLVGVDAVARESLGGTGGIRVAFRCGLLASLFVLGAAAGSVLLQPGAPLAGVVAPYVTLWAAATALSAVGAAAGRLMRHPLDAAMCALVLSLAAGMGVLVAGPLVDGAPESVINGALLASPVVATASAADIDLLRGEPLYRFSPIAHSQFAYPDWPIACVIYAAVAALCFVLVVTAQKDRRMLSAERITL